MHHGRTINHEQHVPSLKCRYFSSVGHAKLVWVAAARVQGADGSALPACAPSLPYTIQGSASTLWGPFLIRAKPHNLQCRRGTAGQSAPQATRNPLWLSTLDWCSARASAGTQRGGARAGGLHDPLPSRGPAKTSWDGSRSTQRTVLGWSLVAVRQSARHTPSPGGCGLVLPRRRACIRSRQRSTAACPPRPRSTWPSNAGYLADTAKESGISAAGSRRALSVFYGSGRPTKCRAFCRSLSLSLCLPVLFLCKTTVRTYTVHVPITRR
jgi:hypothetical protein